MVFNPYRLYHKPPLRGGFFWLLYHKPPLRGGFFWLLFRPEKLVPCPCLPRWATMVAKHEVKCIRCVHEDGAPCAMYKKPRQMVVMVGSGSSGDSFELKGAEWADVKAGSLDSDVRAQARKRPKNAAIASARASTSFSAPDFELTGDAGS